MLIPTNPITYKTTMQVTTTSKALLASVKGATSVLQDALCYRDLKTLVEAHVEALHLIGNTADWEISTYLMQCGREAKAAYWQHFNALTTVDMYIKEAACDATFKLRCELSGYVKAETKDLEDPDHHAYNLYQLLNELD